MFIRIRESKYYVVALYTDAKQGFNAEIEQADGKHFTLSYSTITSRFYKNNESIEGKRIPKYLCKEVLNLATSSGICILSDVEKENAMYWL